VDVPDVRSPIRWGAWERGQVGAGVIEAAFGHPLLFLIAGVLGIAIGIGAAWLVAKWVYP